MKKLSNAEMGLVFKPLPVNVRDAISEFPTKVILAGGYIRSVIAEEPISDIDLFVNDKEIAKKVVNFLDPLASHEKVVTANGTTIKGYRHPIQVITCADFASPNALILDFDFTICCAAVWWSPLDGWTSSVHDDFFDDVRNYELRYMGGANRSDTLTRILKYTARGYKISNKDFATIVAQTIDSTGMAECSAENMTAALLRRFNGPPSAPVKSGNYF